MQCSNIIFDSFVLLKDLRNAYTKYPLRDDNEMTMSRFLALLIPHISLPAVMALQARLPLPENNHSIGVFHLYHRFNRTALF